MGDELVLSFRTDGDIGDREPFAELDQVVLAKRSLCSGRLRKLRRPLRVLPGGRAGTRGLGASTGPGTFRSRPARRRYLFLGTVSLVVGLGTAAFTAGGGGQAAPGPKITPPVELYSVQHAIITGEVPFSAPSSRPAWHTFAPGSGASAPWRPACSR